MITLIGIGLLGGLITGISPCILPVLPVIVAGGAVGEDRARPYWIIAGLVVSFSAFTLAGGALLSALHLPQDLLRDLGIAVLLLLALGLVIPTIGELLERPFLRLGGSRQASRGGGVVLGASLGLVFVPCAGPVLAAISVVAASHKVGISTVVLTLAYAVGAAIPLLIFAVLAQRSVTSFRSLKEHTPLIRRIAGVVLGLTALAIAFDLTTPLQTATPGYASSLENSIGGSGAGAAALRSVTGEAPPKFTGGSGSSSLADLGAAPGFRQISSWLNTPGDRPITLSSLRGRVVLVDFWTYSCINCLRTLPHVEAWAQRYKRDGFVVVGVHSPEFAFEHVRSNVASAASRLGVHYPIALDNSFGTWDAYGNQYWPAEYLIDAQGHVRHTNFGEGDYGGSEAAIRSLLRADGATKLPPPTTLPDTTPTTQTTPESYLGSSRLNNQVGTPIVPDQMTRYSAPATIPADSLAFVGDFNVASEKARAGRGAKIVLAFTAQQVNLVLGGTGQVTVALNGRTLQTIPVSGPPKLVTLLQAPSSLSGTITLSLTPGLDAYDFTFG